MDDNVYVIIQESPNIMPFILRLSKEEVARIKENYIKHKEVSFYDDLKEDILYIQAL